MQIDLYSLHVLLRHHYQSGDIDELRSEVWFPSECIYLQEFTAGWRESHAQTLDQHDINTVERALLALKSAAGRHYSAIRAHYSQGLGPRPTVALRNLAALWPDDSVTGNIQQAK